MSAMRHRGFSWKEVAQVLHMTPDVARITFWGQISRSRAKKDKTPTSEKLIQEESGRDTEKVDKPGESRF